jgi:hypothetical protein
MTAFPSDLNAQSINIEPYLLIDQLSTTEFYIGTSKSFKTQSAENWRIKKIYQSGTIWIIAYPNGDQGFNYKWSDRLTYTYE